MTRGRDRIRFGFTLLEVLCATLLATMLLVAVLGVVAGLAKAERTLQKSSPAPDWCDRLGSRIERDLGAASTWRPLADGFLLEGVMGSDANGATTWTEASVSYRVVGSPLGKVLVRSEQDADPRVGARLELVVSGVSHLAAVAPGEIVPPGGYAEEQSTITLPEGPAPEVFRFVLFGPSQAVMFDEVILRR